MTHQYNLTVFYEDTDAGGVVYHSRYLNFAERARTTWLHELGITNTNALEKFGVYFAVKKAEVDYHRPAKLEDALTIATSIHTTSKATITFEQLIKRDDELLVTLHITIVAMTPDGRPARLPDNLLKLQK